MNLKRVAGIDYSLTSPAICIYSEENSGGLYNFDRCTLYYLFNSEKQRQLSTGSGIENIIAMPYPEWDTDQERYDKLSNWVIELIQSCDEVYLEGYAYGRHYQQGPIYESTGLLKHKMWKHKLNYFLVAPTKIKKYATGKGTANKELMYNSFTSELLTPPDLPKILTPKSKKITSPITDIVDSYFICKYGQEGFII